jgi:hypothetical protein
MVAVVEAAMSIGKWKPRRERLCAGCTTAFWPKGPTDLRCQDCRAKDGPPPRVRHLRPVEPVDATEELSAEELERPTWLVDALAEMTVAALARRIENPNLPCTAVLAREELARRAVSAD